MDFADGVFLAYVYLKAISFWIFPTEYAAAMLSCVCLTIFLMIVMALSNLGLGLRAFVSALYRKPREASTKPQYKEQLADKLRSTRDTGVTFASIVTAIIGIIVAVATWQGSTRLPYVNAIIYSTTFILILAAFVLIHCVDMCNTALNPGLPISFLERVRAQSANYYAAGMILMNTGLIIGLSTISPYLTSAASVSFMILMTHYVFMWKP